MRVSILHSLGLYIESAQHYGHMHIIHLNILIHALYTNAHALTHMHADLKTKTHRHTLIETLPHSSSMHVSDSMQTHFSLSLLNARSFSSRRNNIRRVDWRSHLYGCHRYFIEFNRSVSGFPPSRALTSFQRRCLPPNDH